MEKIIIFIKEKRKELEQKNIICFLHNFLPIPALTIIVLIMIELFYYMTPIIKTGLLSLYILTSILVFIKALKSYSKESKYYRTDDRSFLYNLEKDGIINNSLLQLYDLSVMSKENKNEVLSKAVIQQLEKVKIPLKTPLFRVEKLQKKIINLSIVLSSLVIFFNLDTLNDSFFRFIDFNTFYMKPANHSISLTLTDKKYIEGDTLKAVVGIKGILPDKIDFIHKGSDDGYYDSKSIKTIDSMMVFNRILVKGANHFFVKSEDACSDTIDIYALKIPSISEIKLIITPPDYTKLPIDTLNNLIDKIEVIQGSKLSFFIMSNDKPDSIRIEKKYNFTTKIETIDKFDEHTFHTEIIADSIKVFNFSLYKEDIHSRDVIEYKVSTILDEKPVVSLINPPDNYPIDRNFNIPLVWTAFDDFSIVSSYLYLKKFPADPYGLNLPVVEKKVKLSFERNSDGSVGYANYYDLSELNLYSDDRVELYVKVFDNDKFNGNKSAVSKTVSIYVPTLTELLSSAQENYEKQIGDVKENLQTSEELKKNLENISDRLKAEGNLKWEDKMSLNKAFENQKEMLETMENVKKDIEENIKQLSDNSLLSNETMKKYEKLQDLIDEVFSTELKQKMEKLNQSLDKDSLSEKDFENILQQMKDQEESFRESMEKTINILEQIKKEHLVDSFIKTMDELVEEQERINKNIEDENKRADQLKFDEKAAGELYKKALANLDSVGHQLFHDEKTLDLLDSIISSETDKSIRSDLESMEKTLGKDKEGSLKSGKNLKNSFSQMASSANNLKQEMINDEKSKLISRLEIIKRKLITLSRLSDDYRANIGNLSRDDKKGGQKLVENKYLNEWHGLNFDKIYELSRETFFIDNVIAMLMERVDESYGRVENYSEFRSFNSISAEYNNILRYDNSLVLALDDAIKKIEDSASPSGLEEMLKKMEELAEQQQQLNQQSQQMMGMSGSSMQQMMSKLAAEQQALQDALSEMMKNSGMENNNGSPQDGGQNPGGSQPGGQQGGSQPGGNQPGGNQGNQQGGNSGDSGNGSSGKSKNNGLGEKLSDLGDSMSKLNDQLKDKQMNEDILKRQEEVYDKMLDAINSMRKEKFSNKRESNASDLRAVDPGNIDIIDPRSELRRQMLRSLKDGYNKTYRERIRKFYKQQGNSINND
ncbi:MAG: hypothetical protein JXR48_02900 [Candidatus Delongbacteria bacterium]|nr:hypothetical protein [Candidatus Delongbacteria bacterium]MBN2833896.1 hypothetical protein [Candidatus Delongbacteria bacterium]